METVLPLFHVLFNRIQNDNSYEFILYLLNTACMVTEIVPQIFK